MTPTAHIGPTISIKGEVMSEEPLTIAGHVDGSVARATRSRRSIEYAAIVPPARGVPRQPYYVQSENALVLPRPQQRGDRAGC
jgi:hypothetical protein